MALEKGMWKILFLALAVSCALAHKDDDDDHPLCEGGGKSDGKSCPAQDYAGSYGVATGCPNAEWIVRKTVEEHFKSDNTIVAGILRLHFHDCFVNGCDGSVLLDSTPSDGTEVEKLAAPNLRSARGFEVIEAAKSELEKACPQTVSCADTLALAARDSSALLGGLHYNVPLGRYDGRVSSKALANANLPGPNMTVEQLQERFWRHKLSTQDLVILSGGHTIGASKCFLFLDRLYNFSSTGKPDPSLDASYLAKLREICPPDSNPGPSVELDKGSRHRFDNSYYRNILKGKGLLTSDQTLALSPETRDMVRMLASNFKQFQWEFTQAMIKMGNIGWKIKANGEIRKKCNAVNPTISAS